MLALRVRLRCVVLVELLGPPTEVSTGVLWV